MKEVDLYSELILFVLNPTDYYNLKEVTKPHVSGAGGIYLHTKDNLQIMDFTTGLSGCNLGHNHPDVLSAVGRLMELYSQSAGNFDYSKIIFQLRDTVAELLPPDYSSFYLTRTEIDAEDYAIWMAIALKNRSTFVKVEFKINCNSDSSSTISLNANQKYLDFNQNSSLYIIDCSISYDYLEEHSEESIAFELLTYIQDEMYPPTKPENLAAIIVGVGERENGFIPPPTNLLSAIRFLCDQYGILLIINEGRTAIGRTGLILTSQKSDINPDLIILGKGIANGYELGCVAINHRVVHGLIEDKWNRIEINPIACAAAVSTLNVMIEQDLLNNCRKMGDRLLNGMEILKQKFPVIRDVKGSGLNISLDLCLPDNYEQDSTSNKDLVHHVLDKGLLLYKTDLSGRKVCLMPPLNVNKDQIDQALNVLYFSLENIY